MTRGHLMKVSKEWEQTRTIAHNIYLNRPIKGNHRGMREFMPLPTDKFQKTDLKAEEMRQTWKKFSKQQ